MRRSDNWKLNYEGWLPAQEGLREALCTLGNGYFATRGAGEECRADGVHYPGTYIGGGYDRAVSHVAGRSIENEDLVNWPNWLVLRLKTGNHWLAPESADVLEYRQVLDLREGELNRTVRYRDDQGKETSVVSRRVVHIEQPHRAAIQWRITPHNWSGEATVESALDGRVTNSGVERYRALNSIHLDPLDTGYDSPDVLWLLVRTRQSDIHMAQACRTQVFAGSRRVKARTREEQHPSYVKQELSFRVEEGEEYVVEKTVGLYTSRDFAISNPLGEARDSVQEAPRFEALLDSHVDTWSRVWRRCDMEIDGGEAQTQLIVRLHIFHLMQVATKNIMEMDVGVPSRGLHGEAYRGHILWDELFILPFLNYRIPELTRQFLMYRYRRLARARDAAVREGYRGAMFPWQSGSNGREESQQVHLNPRSGRWVPDHTYLQRHVNAAIVHNLWRYYEVTHDREFLQFFGAEVILEVARFWSSKASYDRENDRFEIKGVVGPDEYHTSYPDTAEPGLNDNAYTNVMAAWVMHRALDLLERLAPSRREELVARLGIDEVERKRWEHIGRRMKVPFSGSSGVISQFEGYEEFQELDWGAYRERHGEHFRLDRVLEAEGDDVNRYKASKQADVLMLFYLFSADQLKRLFDRLDYGFDPEWIRRNIGYYASRTSHGSTLSRLVHSWVFSRSDRKKSWQEFLVALTSDYRDVQGGTTPEGIHLGAMAGTIDMLQRCYTGLEVEDNVVWFNPCLPEEISSLKLRIRFRGNWLTIRLTQHELQLHFEEGAHKRMRVGFRTAVHELLRGERRTFRLHVGAQQQVSVRQAMKQVSETLQSDDTAMAAVQKMKACDVQVLPVYEGNTVVGMLSSADVVAGTVAAGVAPEAVTAGDTMSRDIVWISEEDSVREAIDTMRREGVMHLLVKDAQGMYRGSLTLEDAAVRLLSGRAEEELVEAPAQA